MTDSFSRTVHQQVQKFRYVEGNGDPSQGYRELLATFANVSAAAEDDAQRTMQIEAACQSGGDFVGDYYFQYEVRDHIMPISSLGWYLLVLTHPVAADQHDSGSVAKSRTMAKTRGDEDVDGISNVSAKDGASRLVSAGKP
jgi:hypothetical protein